MRLICPNCDAQYEVADDVIPPEGRDVQCSNCAKTWFQESAAAQREAAARAAKDPEHLARVPDAEFDDLAEEPEFDAPRTYRRRSRPPVPEEVSDILREEAEVETRARAAEGTQFESQPDLGIEEAPSQRRRSAQVEEDPAQADDVTDAVSQFVSSNRDLLPDIEEINSTLTATPEQTQNATDDDGVDLARLARRRKTGFRAGFGLMLILAVAATGTYVFAPALATQYPEAQGALAAYVTGTDAVRLWLDTWVTEGMQSLTQMMSEAVAEEG